MAEKIPSAAIEVDEQYKPAIIQTQDPTPQTTTTTIPPERPSSETSFESGISKNNGDPTSKPSSTDTITVDRPPQGDSEKDLEKNPPGATEATTAKITAPRDPNIVDFDGPDDPACATNWTKRKKWNNIAILSAMTFITYITPYIPNPPLSH